MPLAAAALLCGFAFGLAALVQPLLGTPPARRGTVALGLGAAGAGAAAGVAGAGVLLGVRGAPPLVALGVMGAAGLVTLWVDARRFLVPDACVLALAAAAPFSPAWPGWPAALAGAALGALLLLGVRWLYGRARGVEGLGLGDVKLFAALGLWLGPVALSWVILAACALGLGWALLTPPSPAGTRRAPLGAAAVPPALAAVLWLCR